MGNLYFSPNPLYDDIEGSSSDDDLPSVIFALKPAVNAVSRHLVSFQTDPTKTAEALAEQAMYKPSLPINPAIDTSKVAWDVVLPRPQAIYRTIAVTDGGRIRSSPAEDELVQLMTEFKLLGNNTVL